jgi:hypothetical protein
MKFAIFAVGFAFFFVSTHFVYSDDDVVSICINKVRSYDHSISGSEANDLCYSPSGEPIVNPYGPFNCLLALDRACEDGQNCSGRYLRYLCRGSSDPIADYQDPRSTIHCALSVLNASYADHYDIDRALESCTQSFRDNHFSNIIRFVAVAGGVVSFLVVTQSLPQGLLRFQPTQGLPRPGFQPIIQTLFPAGAPAAFIGD